MKTYNISVNNLYLSNNIQNIDVKDIDKLINDSVDNIFVYCLNVLPEEKAKLTIDTLLNKLGLNGNINISILNVNHYIKDFIEQKIAKQDFLNAIHQLQAIVTTDEIISSLDAKKYQIQQIADQQHSTSIVIRKISL